MSQQVTWLRAQNILKEPSNDDHTKTQSSDLGGGFAGLTGAEAQAPSPLTSL